MSVLRTAWNTRWVYLLTLGLTLAWGLAGGSIVAWMTQFVLGPYGGEADQEHALARLAELVLSNPELGVGVGASTAISAALAWLAWMALGGIVFPAARGDAFADAVRTGLRAAGPLMAQGVVHALLSAAGLVLVSVVLGPLPGIVRGVGLLATAAFAVLARDLVRAQICLHGLDAPYHPRATLRGFVAAARRPKEIAITGGLWLLKMAAALALVPLAIRALGPSDAGGLLRLIAAGGLAVSFIRLAWVTHWTPVDLAAPLTSEEDGAEAAPADAA